MPTQQNATQRNATQRDATRSTLFTPGRNERARELCSFDKSSGAHESRYGDGNEC